jgi:hypothetical protein
MFIEHHIACDLQACMARRQLYGRVGHGGVDGAGRRIAEQEEGGAGWLRRGRQLDWVGPTRPEGGVGETRDERHMSTSEESQPHHQRSHMSLV